MSKQEAERGGNTKSKVKTLESKLENALNAVVKQSQAGEQIHNKCQNRTGGGIVRLHLWPMHL